MGDEAPAVLETEQPVEPVVEEQPPVADPVVDPEPAAVDTAEPVAAADTAEPPADPPPTEVSPVDALATKTAETQATIERRLVGLAQSLVGATYLSGSPAAGKVCEAAEVSTAAVQSDGDSTNFEGRCLALIDALEELVANPAAPVIESRELAVEEPAPPAPEVPAAPPVKKPAAAPKPKPKPKLPEPKEYQLLGGRPKFGEGREMLPGGGYYEGQFRHFKRHGEGFLIMDAEGTEKYEGQFKDEFMDGYGRRVWKDGAVYEGYWAKGRKDGEGKFEEKGRCYDGMWKDGKRHGKGTQVFDTLTRYEGRWANGMQHGTGKYYSEEDGSIFEGHWHNGAHHGIGILHKKDGSKERLQYHHGMLQGRDLIPPPTVYPPPSKVVGC
eukprot:gnl/MRDRNA2_/MRDRNA2_89880_c0_seq1.p1 gnl/MRDRNA2_/MRDRNA2_89880_c0~~gnl/MRDRNA2_/MRDRNA2_89880_c0_seq1.p1  ORF type:complete len:383 (+),score=97.54 gnl/MRDRNA2_/MRDRNA2_89880_c0_seq1:84-1232(+)